MTQQLKQYADKINALSLRERGIITLSVIIAMVFLWWNFYLQPVQQKMDSIEQGNRLLTGEIESLQVAMQAIQERIQQGVHKSEEEKLALLQAELDQINEVLEQKTLALIDPDEMFELMQELIFAESKLKLTELKRKEVKPLFETEESDEGQPKIYRHSMQMSLRGRYRDVLNYVASMENLEWKLLWDRITLKTAEYPMIDVDIEISTLSDNQNWVGL
ncbi:MAG: hypothetical protein QNJ69_07415 [Gammaproteobacteria bacterium]|nr:hypothetical protein [Gammaproteobacteria bacterium]